MGVLEVAIYAAIAGIVIIATILTRNAGMGRRRMLIRWARSRGLRFWAHGDDTLELRLPKFRCLRRGSGRRAVREVRGRWEGREFLGVDYRYTSHFGGGDRECEFSAVVVGSSVRLKPLLVRPEGFVDRLGRLVGMEDIAFESAEFNREFFVVSSDRRWAYDVLHPRAMGFLLRMPRFGIELRGRYAIAWRDELFGPIAFDDAATVLCGLLDLLPEYVLPRQRAPG